MSWLCRVFGHKRVAFHTTRGRVYWANCPRCGVRI